MSVFARPLAVIREALATARSQPVASAVTIVIVAGMCATVLLTTGRTVGAEQAVINTIDQAGTRSIVVRAEADSGLDTSVLQRLQQIEGIEWLAAFGAAEDFTNSSFPDGVKVPVRVAWSRDLNELGIPPEQPLEQSAWASSLALERLGMPYAAGGLQSGAGSTHAVVGRLEVPDYLEFLEPVVLVPRSVDPVAADAVSVLVIVAARPDLVSPIAAAAQSVLGVNDITKVTVTTSESLAALRTVIQGQLGSFGRNLVIVIFALTAVLVAAILYGLVMLRRKDFGRRRALGSSRRLVILLLLTQTGALSAAGGVIGCVSAAAGLALSGDPLPSIQFFVAVAVLAVAVGVLAAILPALAAARRDPLKELRVP